MNVFDVREKLAHIAVQCLSKKRLIRTTKSFNYKKGKDIYDVLHGFEELQRRSQSRNEWFEDAVDDVTLDSTRRVKIRSVAHPRRGLIPTDPRIPFLAFNK